jgi:hypothetical protein
MGLLRIESAETGDVYVIHHGNQLRYENMIAWSDDNNHFSAALPLFRLNLVCINPFLPQIRFF